jgi:hypothetical protein
VRGKDTRTVAIAARYVYVSIASISKIFVLKIVAEYSMLRLIVATARDE